MDDADLFDERIKAEDVVGNLYLNEFTCPECSRSVHFISAGRNKAHFRHFNYNPKCKRSREESGTGSSLHPVDIMEMIVDDVLATDRKLKRKKNSGFATLYVSYGMHWAKWTLTHPPTGLGLLPLLASRFILRTKYAISDPTPKEICMGCKQELWYFKRPFHLDKDLERCSFKYWYYPDPKTDKHIQVYTSNNICENNTSIYFPIDDRTSREGDARIFTFFDQGKESICSALVGDDGLFYTVSGIYRRVKGREDCVELYDVYPGTINVNIPLALLPVHLADDPEMMDDYYNAEPLTVIGIAAKRSVPREKHVRCVSYPNILEYIGRKTRDLPLGKVYDAPLSRVNPFSCQFLWEPKDHSDDTRWM